MAGTPVLTAAVSVSGLTIERAGRRLFDEMSWSLSPGSFIAVTGPSGAGKSSLLACLAGELDAASGQIAIEGPTGVIFQDLRLSTNLSVLTNVLCGRLGNFPWWKTLFNFPIGDRADAFLIIQRLGLADLLHKSVANTSGGEQQRTAVARTLLYGPDIILADEPTSQLDRSLAVTVLRMLKDYCADGRTVVSVLHDRSLVEEFADIELVIDASLKRGWEIRELAL